MSVTEIHQGAGSWTLTLAGTISKQFLDTTLTYFGHIAIVAGRVNPAQLGDNLLNDGVSRYVGVVRRKQLGDSTVVTGAGMVTWLGDEDDKGDLYEVAQQFTGQTFANTIRALLPASGAITEGTLHSVAGTYTGRHQWESPRKAIAYVCDTFSAEYRVNHNGTLDAGLAANLFVTTPTCVIVRKDAGRDMTLTGLPGSFSTERDVEDFTTRVVLLAEGEGDSIATGSANIAPGLNPYKDVHGNTVVRTRLVSESDTSTGNASARAQLQLNRFTGLRNALRLSTRDYDVKGTFDVGDYVWVYDPDAGLYDTSQEITFRGQRINPIKLRVVETAWPVTRGMTVAYRDLTGGWHDLTDHVQFESDADTTIVVGDLSRSLTSAGTEPVGDRPAVDTSTPAAPVFVTPFQTQTYLDARGFSRSRVILSWTAPLNTDGSTVLDGDHYEIRYRVDTDAIYPQTWASISSTPWNSLNTWSQPFTPSLAQWQIMYVAWGETQAILHELATGVGYDAQIRAVDHAGNIGAWSSPETTFITSPDNIPPSTPAPPSVAGSRIALQITHELGKASGGTFNLESDLQHLEIHVDVEPLFLPSDATLKGKVVTTAGMIQAQVPAVVTVPVEEVTERWVKVVAVDIAGNKSGASAAANATALLIDDAHISDLTVSKVTAGTINADWLIAASLKTANTGARVEFSSAGLLAFDSANNQTVSISAQTGAVEIVGRLQTGTDDNHIEIEQSVGTGWIFFEGGPGISEGLITGTTTGSGVELQIRSRNVLPGAYTQVQLSDQLALFSKKDNLTSSDQFSIFLTQSVATIGFDDFSPGSNSNQLVFSDDGFTSHEGKWDYTSPDPGLIMGQSEFGSAIAGFTQSYSGTLDTEPWLQVMLEDQPAVDRFASLTNVTTSNFEVDVPSGTTSGFSQFFWWGVRGE